MTKTDQIIRLAQALSADNDLPHHLHEKIAHEMTAQALYDQLHGVQLSLYNYLTAVKMVIQDSFDHEVWVRAEIESVRTKSGHVYFELSQKDDEHITASCRATLWRYHAQKILNKFQASTGQTLKAGMSILVKGSATFHAQYGFSFNITDIDPNHTLGAIAHAYQAMYQKLHENGLTTLNASLPMPFDIRHVIVISPDQSAGLGDFRREANRLQNAQVCHFHYHHATFQGNHAPSEIRHAIKHAMEDFYQTHGQLPDLMAIIRGGGAVRDLAHLNDYELACLVAEQPIPVWVGIGHERDKVILDEVAHTRFDTPSKVIAGIENHLIHHTTLAKSLMAQIHTLCQARLQNAKTTTNKQLNHIKHNSQTLTNYTKKDCQLVSYRFKHHAWRQLAIHKNTLQHYKLSHQTVLPRLRQLSEHCRQLQSMILLHHPTHTLKKGYALIHQNDQLITSASQMQAGTIHITWHDGKRTAIFEKS